MRVSYTDISAPILAAGFPPVLLCLLVLACFKTWYSSYMILGFWVLAWWIDFESNSLISAILTSRTQFSQLCFFACSASLLLNLIHMYVQLIHDIWVWIWWIDFDFCKSVNLKRKIHEMKSRGVRNQSNILNFVLKTEPTPSNIHLRASKPMHRKRQKVRMYIWLNIILFFSIHRNQGNLYLIEPGKDQKNWDSQISLL